MTITVNAKNKTVVVIPYQAFYYPSYIVASAVISITLDSNNSFTALADGCSVLIAMQFNVAVNGPSVLSINILISNFNTPTQSATYSISSTECLTKGDVVDRLDLSYADRPLSANQGRVLKDLLDKTSGVTVENSLTSTSTTAALSANQGRVLKGLVDGKVGSSEVTTIKKLTQSAYNALSTKDSKTLYVIVG